MSICGCKPAPDSCGCSDKLPAPGLQLAIATVPIQPWETPYDPETALKQGTVFPGLDKPFYVTGGGVNG